MTLNVIDISSYQAGLVPSRVPANAIIIKATEGTGYINPTFRAQANATLASGKKLGLYHFIHGGNGVAQADYFVGQIKPYIGKAMLVLDFESTPGSNARSNAMVAQGRAFLDRVVALTGVRPVVYTNTDFEQHLDWSAVVRANYGLWIAQYNTTAAISGFRPHAYGYKLIHWPSLVMYQYHDNTRISGYAGGLDASIFYGDRSIWDKYANPSGKATAAPKSAPAKPAAKPTGSAPIRAVQSWLNTAYGTKLVVDGFNGVKTHAALVVGIQTELRRQFGFKIGIDGIAGKDTDRALTPVKVQKGDSGNITKLIQANLICRGYAVVGGLDGKYGNGTAAAVRTFQAAVGLVPDAIAGGWTLKALF